MKLLSPAFTLYHFITQLEVVASEHHLLLARCSFFRIILRSPLLHILPSPLP